jgi:hypothetical protein
MASYWHVYTPQRPADPASHIPSHRQDASRGRVAAIHRWQEPGQTSADQAGMAVEDLSHKHVCCGNHSSGITGRPARVVRASFTTICYCFSCIVTMSLQLCHESGSHAVVFWIVRARALRSKQYAAVLFLFGFVASKHLFTFTSAKLRCKYSPCFSSMQISA